MKTQQSGRILMVFSVMTALVLATSSAFAGMLVDSQWVNSMAGKPDVKIIDVQKKDDAYEIGHIPGALRVASHVDLEDYTRYTPNKYPQQAQFLDLMTRLGISNNDTIVAYDDKQGIFASRFLFVMKLYGHDPNKLKVLDGGIVQWQKANNSMTTEPVTAVSAPPYKTSGPNQDLLVTWNDVLRDTVDGQKSEVVLLDSRPVDEFTGKNIRAIRGGHIPGAINVTGASAANDKESHLYKSAEQIRATFAEAGITSDKTVYVYCHSSDRAAHVYMVLTQMLGYKNVKIYDGSWKEWAALTALPAANESWQVAVPTK
jgi:thiosulfate/3-mercaptopyruvate sulfurtransferase